MDSAAPPDTSRPPLTGEDRAVMVWRLTERMDDEDWTRGDWAQGAELGREAWALAQSLGDGLRLAYSLLHLADCEWRLLQFGAAETHTREALQRFEALGDVYGQARSWQRLGTLHGYLGQYLPALGSLYTALELSRQAGDLSLEARSLNNLGNVHAGLSDYAAAVEHRFQALRLYEQLGDQANRAMCLNNVAMTYSMLGRHEEALVLVQEAVQMDRAAASHDLHDTLTSLAEIQLQLGQHGEAGAALQEALLLARGQQDRRGTLAILHWLGKLAAAQGDPGQAAHYYGRALELLPEVKDLTWDALLHLHLGEVLLSLDPPAARAPLEQALGTAGREGQLAQAREAHRLLAQWHAARGEYREAYTHHQAYHGLDKRIFNEEQDRRAQSLLIQHQVEKTREVAEAQRALNEELRRTNGELQRINEELAEASRRNELLLAQLRYQAQHDTLTGLPNRALFEDRLQETVAHAARDTGLFAVMFLDLDGFKHVNDSLGHDVGDELLVRVAGRFRRLLRASDTVARLGGDEFTVIASNLRQSADAAAVAHKLLHALEAPFDIRGQEVTVGASIGVSLYPRDGRDIVTLQRHADLAMYEVKRGSKRAVRFYSPGTDT